MPDDSTHDESIDDGRSKATEVAGTIKKAVGWATGDRDVEAEGEAQEALGSEPSDTQVAQVKTEVKKRYSEAADAEEDPLRE